MTGRVRHTVDSSGNIHAHPLTGVKVPIRDQQEDLTPIDISARQWRFRTHTIDKLLVPDPDDPMGLLLIITIAEAAALPVETSVPFLITDETGEERWAAQLRRRTW